MKNLTIIFLLLPFFSMAQYGIKDCHTDLVFGYDYGNRIDFDRKNRYQGLSLSSLQTFRIGTNISYPIGQRSFLVSGFRVASRFSYEDLSVWGLNPETPVDYIRTDSRDFFAEIPFTFRFILKNINRENRLFLETGIQFNFYVASFWKEKYLNSGSEIDQRIERTNGFRDMHLSSQFSIGWEHELKNASTFFIQSANRFELIPADYSYDKSVYHVGLETGIRF